MTIRPSVIDRLALHEMLDEPIVDDLMRRDGVTKRDILGALCQARRKRAIRKSGLDLIGYADGTWSEPWKRLS